ncbi:MAG: efflux RND transporter permease subunit [Phycisphaerales bacterium]|nr:efflux RND transporter permease subunit [Phycisphaerales bacterium]
MTPPAAPLVSGPIERLMRFFLENKLVVALLLIGIIGWGLSVMPFRGGPQWLPRDPIPVDAIPDVGENQQVVFTDWPGRSPQDVEDQITYPLTTALQGTPGVKTIRASSMFGFSIVFVIFDDQHDFYWCRSRLLEKLDVARQRLPEGVTPGLGPDATALGQVFWYTLEATHGGFDLMELRSIQDWFVRYQLQAIAGVSEVAGVGGYVREYQIDIDPEAMRAHRVSPGDVMMAVQRSNLDIGAETLEFNGVEYVLRGKGFLRGVQDIENTIIRAEANVPLMVRNVATVRIAPALRRGMLDKDGVEAVGGVVLARFGSNPQDVIDRVQARIAELTPLLPKKTLAGGTVSEVRIVPFYDRSGLIRETLTTLQDALVEQVLITTFVVLMFLRHLRSCVVIALTLPLAILVCFILMKLFHVDSNLMSLGGIAIAVGTLVDMGIILTENIVRHLEADRQNRPLLEIVWDATREIGSAVITAILMTVVAFLPVFALEDIEGRLFRPLAYTKTFALLGSLIVAILILPALAHIIFTPFARRPGMLRWAAPLGFVAVGIAACAYGWWWAGIAAATYGLFLVLEANLPQRALRWGASLASLAVMATVLIALTQHWMPLGPDKGLSRNLVIVLGLNLVWASVRIIFIDFYPYFLRIFLDHKLLFLSVPVMLVLFGATIWLGFEKSFSWLPRPAQHLEAAEAGIYQALWTEGVHRFPGLGREYFPPLDEGSFLYMPSLMPHAGIGVALDAISQQDRAIRAIPEVESVVGKIGRAETAIDPAPISMIETVILYKSEFKRDPLTGDLVLDSDGKSIRQWRDHIRSPADIWSEVEKAARFPGMTGAPFLQPISARIVMLQSGMRASMGVKIYGQKLEEIEQLGYRIADQLRRVPGIDAETVAPDRVVGKPYLEIELDRERCARHGVSVRDALDTLEVTLGGIRATTTVEGRQRYPVRIRYPRERRGDIEQIERIAAPGTRGEQVPLSQIATIQYVRGPEMIKSEDNFLVSYVTFDKRPGFAEVEVVEAARELLENVRGDLAVPAGTRYAFAGSYENQLRFQARLNIILPISFLLLFLLLYWEFRSVPISLIVFTGIPVAWAGGFIGLWLVAQPWFCDFNVFGENVRHLLHFQTYNLSAAVWVGFLALFSVTVDDGVVLATYLRNEFVGREINSPRDIREAIVQAGSRRVRPCLMTSATTVLSLLPVLTSDGRGADVMIPIALPAVGGLSIELLSLFVLPVCYSLYREMQWRWSRKTA